MKYKTLRARKEKTGVGRTSSKHIDFMIEFDPDKDSETEVGNRIIWSLVHNRLEADKPCVWFIGGDSGEGKSETALKIMEKVLAYDELQLLEFLDDINVFTPLEYSKKIKALLKEKRLKPLKCICMHEARLVVKSKHWGGLVELAIADINALIRAQKPILIMVCSQFIRDITKDVRYTLNYYSTVERSNSKHAQVKLRTWAMWKNDNDLENPRLMKRRIKGYLVYPDGRKQLYSPRHLTVGRIPQEIRKKFKQLDREAKKPIIEQKQEQLRKAIETDLGLSDKKVYSMVDYYTDNPQHLNTIGRFKGKSFQIKKVIKKMHDLTDPEMKLFKKALNLELIKKGMSEATEEEVLKMYDKEVMEG